MTLTYSSAVATACEEHNTNKATLTDANNEATVVLRVPWASRFDLCVDLLGLSDGSPKSHPSMPGLWAVNCGIADDGSKGSPNGQGIDYDFALVTVKYSDNYPTKDKTEDGQIYSDNIEPAIEFITLDHSKFKWQDSDGDTLKEAEAPGRQLFSCTFSRTLYRVTSLPAGILSYCGKVHNASFTAHGLTFDSETLLFMPATFANSVTTGGSKGYDVTCKWAFKPEGWNKFWRAKSQAYEEIWDTASNQVYKNYPAVDMSVLLF